MTVEKIELSQKDKHAPIALLVIDVQKGLFKKSTPIYKAEQLLENINALIRRAGRAGAPVLYIQHANKMLVEGTDDWELHPELERLEAGVAIHKRQGNAFQDTNLREELEAREIRRLVITGLVTHGCVKATCIGAKSQGYEVVLVKDGHSSYSKQAAKLIAEWNEKLSEGTVELGATEEIAFRDTSISPGKT
jgi:nicotinamidase-related amidase